MTNSGGSIVAPNLALSIGSTLDNSNGDIEANQLALSATDPGSVSGSGGLVPMIYQNENGDQSSTTRSAVSAGSISVTDQAAQTQDVAALSRDTTDTNGRVSNTPDVQNLLDQQADLMNAAQAAGQVVAQGIGMYADMKRDAALDTAQAAFDRGDLEAAHAALADYNNWKEGGDSRALMQAAGGALIGGLGGGALGAVGGGFGAGLSSKLADQTKAIRDAVSDATDSTLLGNITANIVSGLGGALVGGSAGAAGAANVNLYNQGHDTGEAAAEKKAASLAQQVADAYNYLQQLRQSVGDAVSSAAGQFVGQMNADAQAKMSESPSDLMAQGAANGLNTIIGAGAGTPPTASAGGVLVDAAAGQAMAGAANSVPGYGAGNAIFNDDGGSSSDQTASGKEPTSPVFNPDGAARAAKNSGNWSSGSLSETVAQITGPNPKISYTDSGKTVYTNPDTGKSVVYDNAGNYYRVQDASGQYLDKSGNPLPNNVPVVGQNKTTQTGIPSSLRQALTHYQNTDAK